MGRISCPTLYNVALRDVKAVIIDEISMCGARLFNNVNLRCQQFEGSNSNFGGLDQFACGDLKQLPPVFASPVFSRQVKSLGGEAE